MIILNDGCSFSRNRKEIVPPGRKRLNGRRESYCVFLPDMIDAHNIARSASGIESWGLTNWLKHNNKNTAVTHFIYQIPSPSRQILWPELNDEDFLKAPYIQSFDQSGRHGTYILYWDWIMSLKVLLERGGIGPTGVPYASAKHKLNTKMNKLNVHKLLVKVFEHKERYLIKGLIETEKIVNLIREAYSDIKIIFLRYEESSRPLIYEFCKDFYKNMLPDYCKKNDITYIYEENFNTKWFYANGLCADGRHTNEAGAKVIADKIKEYL